MKYDFDEVIERRNTNAMNTDGFRSYIFHTGPDTKFAFKDDEFIRMWVADMEFSVAEPILKAIHDRTDKRILGYTQVYDNSYYEAISGWFKRHYDYVFPKKELTFSTGVVPAIFQLVELLTKPGDKILTMTPAYSQFANAAKYNQVELVQTAMKNDNGFFSLDVEDFERKAADPYMKLILLCNPHNPTGHIWTEAELNKIAEVAEKYNLWVVSDEIHCDLLRCGNKHIPMAVVMPEYKKLITCFAPSKTFNIAGLMLSDIIIRDDVLRERFNAKDKNVGCLNPISIAAHIAAFNEGDEWLDQLKVYLDGNFQFTKNYFAEHLPNASMQIPDSTYLAWVDLGKCLPDEKDLAMYFANEAGVLLEGGDAQFVGNAEGFVRLNMAMQRSLLEEGLRRICLAVNKKMNQ